MAAACSGPVKDNVGVSRFCSLEDGTWAIQLQHPAATLVSRSTTITGRAATPQRRGALDTTVYGTRLALPANISEPLLRIAPNETFTLNNLKISGGLLRVPRSAEPPAPLAIAVGDGARLRLVNVEIAAASCRTLAYYQLFICNRTLPSPDFNVDAGTVTFLSYTTPHLELINATVTCAASAAATAAATLPPPYCVSVVAAVGDDVLVAVAGPPQRPVLAHGTRIFVHIARNMSLLPSTGSTPAPNPRGAPAPPSPPPLEWPTILTQNLLLISGPPGGTTRLDLTGSTSLIRLVDSAAVVLQDLTLTGLPPGPASAYPLGLLRAPVWTFDFMRRALGRGSQARMTLRNVRLALTPVEVACLARDALAPPLPAPAPPPPPPWRPPPAGTPWVPACAYDFNLLSDDPRDAALVAAAATGPDGTSTSTTTASETATVDSGPSVLLRKAISAYGAIMTFDNVLLQPTVLAGELGSLDWRRHPLCQLLPLQPANEPPRAQISVRYNTLPVPAPQGIDADVMSLGMYTEKSSFVLQRDSWLMTGPSLPPPLGSITFSQRQSYIGGAKVLLGDPVRRRLLDTRSVAAGFNLRSAGASLTLRSMVLSGLAAASLHPSSTASTTKVEGAVAKTSVAAATRQRSRRRLSHTSQPYVTAAAEGRRRWRCGDAGLGGDDGGGDGTSSSGASADCGRVGQPQRRLMQQQQQSPPQVRPEESPLPAEAPQLPAPSWPSHTPIWPAGTDATGGLPPGMANFTSCLWLLDFDRTAAAAGSGGGSGGSGYLDSVVAIVPRKELALFAWLWAANDTAAVTDPAVAQQLRDMLDRSALAPAATAGGAAAAAATVGLGGNDVSGGGDGLITFERLHWCGLKGRNVTLAAAWPPYGGGGGGVLTSFLELELPAQYIHDTVVASPGAAAAPTPPLPPVACVEESGCRLNIPSTAANATASDVDEVSGAGSATGARAATTPADRYPDAKQSSGGGGSSRADPRALIVAVICGVAAGLGVTALVCALVILCVRRRWRDRRQHRKEAAAGMGGCVPPFTSLAEAEAAAGGHTCGACGNGDTNSLKLLHDAADGPVATTAQPSVPSTSEFEGSSCGASGRLSQPAAVLAAAPPAAAGVGPGLAPEAVDGAAAGTAAEAVWSPAATTPAAEAVPAAVVASANETLRGGASLEMLPSPPPPPLWSRLAGPGPPPSTTQSAAAADAKAAAIVDLDSDAAAAGAHWNAVVAAGSATAAGAVSFTHGSQNLTGSASLSPWAHPATSPSAATAAVTAVAAALANPSDADADTSESPSTSATEDTAAAAAVVAAVSQQQERQLLRQVGLSLHTRFIRMRAMVAAGGAAAEGHCFPAFPDEAPPPPPPLPARPGAPAAAAAAAAAAAGETGMLTVTGELGRGAQGVVYRGSWRGIDVAVKSLLLHHLAPAPSRAVSGSDDAAAGAALASLESAATVPELAQARALREAAISVAASQHPNVVATYHVDMCALGAAGAAAGAGAGPGHGTGRVHGPAASASAAVYAAASAASCWKITLVSQLCDGGSLRSALESGLLARCTTTGSAPSANAVRTNAAAAATAADGAALARAIPVDLLTVADAAAAAEATAPSPPQEAQLLPPRVLLLLALDVASGLAQLHSTNIVHGDVSSSNVLLMSRQSQSDSQMGSDCGGAGATAAACFYSGTTITTGTTATSSDPRVTGERLHTSSGVPTDDSWLSYSSDALALLAELPYERVRRARYLGAGGSDGNSFVGSGGGGGGGADGAAASAALGRYGYVAKLCDFGLAEVLPPGQSYIETACRRSSAYTAPELALDGRLGPASDVYSWGVLTWEMAMGTSLPVALGTPSGAAIREWLAAADTAAATAAEPQEPPPPAPAGSALPPALLTWPAHLPGAMVVLVGECLRADPAGRPTARDVVQRLEHIITSL